MFLADAVVETHDRIVGRTYRTAVRTCEAQQPVVLRTLPLDMPSLTHTRVVPVVRPFDLGWKSEG